jgi:hypothetical protein
MEINDELYPLFVRMMHKGKEDVPEDFYLRQIDIEPFVDEL